MKTGAVIIAAGHKSTISRFQPMLPVGDSTVIRRIIITLKRAGIDPVVVITGQKADEVEKHIAGLRVICLRNQDYEQTQMYYSICMGLNYIEDLCDRVFILPAKFPMFLPDTIQRMMGSRAMAACPVYNETGPSGSGVQGSHSVSFGLSRREGTQRGPAAAGNQWAAGRNSGGG